VGKRSENYYLLLYVGVTVANTLFTLSRAFLFAYGGLVAARFLHNKLIKRVLRVFILL
jgi:ATP-binding cassette subfamily C (CFTR/MRP) protein 10